MHVLLVFKMAFAYLDNANIPGDVINIIARRSHELTLSSGLQQIQMLPSAFERFAVRDMSSRSVDDAVTQLTRIYGRDDVMLFTDSCDIYDVGIIAFNDGSDYFIMWFENIYGTIYLIEGQYNYDLDIVNVERLYYKNDSSSEPETNAPYIHHGLNGAPFCILAMIMGEGSTRCTMSMNQIYTSWHNPERVCEWFRRCTSHTYHS